MTVCSKSSNSVYILPLPLEGHISSLTSDMWPVATVLGSEGMTVGSRAIFGYHWWDAPGTGSRVSEPHLWSDVASRMFDTSIHHLCSAPLRRGTVMMSGEGLGGDFANKKIGRKQLKCSPTVVHLGMRVRPNCCPV